MKKAQKTEKIYLILSYTGTLPAKLFKLATRSKYVHVSIAFDEQLDEIYSFGRKYMRTMLPSGFIRENIEEINKAFKNTKCMIYEMEVNKYSYSKLKKNIKSYISEAEKYKYDILGLFLILLDKPYNRKYHRVCSQFVGKLFQDNGIYDFKKHYSLLKPKDFDKIETKQLIYQGLLNDYLNDKKINL